MYKEINDNEIIYMVQENNDYYEVMLKKYEPFIRKMCKKYYNLGKNVGYEYEDLIQIANIGLYEAINSYNENKNVMFYTYVITCIENKIRVELRNQSTNKKKVLNNYISYDREIEGSDITLIDVIKDNNIIDPMDYLIIEEKEIEYVNFINSLPFEVAVIYEMKKDGFTTNQISKFLNMDKETIFKSLQFAKNRICLN